MYVSRGVSSPLVSDCHLAAAGIASRGPIMATAACGHAVPEVKAAIG